jgi:uncharacterized protein YdcH (DUF465 family)
VYVNESVNVKSPSVNARLASLAEKHQEYESRLEVLQGRVHLTPDEEYEEAKLKKLKLALKDEIEKLTRKSGAH